MTLLILLFLILCIYNVKILIIGFCGITYLSTEQTISIRGILSILILIGHTVSFVQFSYGKAIPDFLLGCFIGSGYLAVGVFFLFSGYGLIHSFINKENYLDGFLRKRMPKVIIPFALTNIIYIVMKSIIGEKFNYKEIVCSFFTSSIMPNAWYMITIILFYIVFYIIMKQFEFKKSILLMSTFTIGYMVLCYILGSGDWWYVSCLSFVIGMLWASNEKELINICKNKYYYFIGLSFIAFSLTYRLDIVIYKIFKISVDSLLIMSSILACSFFTLFFILLTMKFKFGNKMLTWYGKISLELYLIHGLIINIVSKFMIINKAYFLILVFLISTIAATILNKLYSKLIYKLVVSEQMSNSFKVSI